MVLARRMASFLFIQTFCFEQYICHSHITNTEYVPFKLCLPNSVSSAFSGGKMNSAEFHSRNRHEMKPLQTKVVFGPQSLFSLPIFKVPVKVGEVCGGMEKKVM